MDFITNTRSGDQHFVRCQLTGTEYPYKLGDVESYKAAEQMAITHQRNLLIAMKESGALATSVKNLDELKAAYAFYNI